MSTSRSRSAYERALERAPIWLLRALGAVELAKRRSWLALLSRLFRTEWTERPAQFPHCCTQGGCWAHADVPVCFCAEGLFGRACFCCRLARLLGKDHPANDDWRERQQPARSPGP